MVLLYDVPTVPFGSEAGLRVIVGQATKVNASPEDRALVPYTVVTLISTVPAPFAGLTAVISVLEITVNDTAEVASKVTAVAPVK